MDMLGMWLGFQQGLKTEESWLQKAPCAKKEAKKKKKVEHQTMPKMQCPNRKRLC